MTTWAVNRGEAGASARALLEAEDGAAGREASVQQRPATVLDRTAEHPDGLAALVSIPAGPLWKSVPVRMAFVPRPQTLAAAARGYAGAGGATRKPPSRTAASRTAASRTAASRTAPASAPVDPALTATATELGFLRDKRFSVEDKLFMFMALMEKKGNKELEQAMEDYAAKRKAAQEAAKAKETAKATESDGGGGLLGSVVGAVQGVAKQLGGPLLASAATAVGLPFLAPAALSLGGKLSSDLVGAVADLAGIEGAGASRASPPRARAPSSSAGGASQSKSDLDDFDEKYEMAKIQRLQEKQNAMFACLSNILKSMHDTGMVAVNNIR